VSHATPVSILSHMTDNAAGLGRKEDWDEEDRQYQRSMSQRRMRSDCLLGGMDGAGQAASSSGSTATHARKRQRGVSVEAVEADEDAIDEGVSEMLSEFLENAQNDISETPVDHQPPSGTILQQQKLLQDTISELCGGWDKDLVRLGVAALAFYRSRYCDIGVREHVLMLHIIAGGDLIRAYDGVLYTYEDGAFHMYSGLVSESILTVCRSFLMCLEGLFTKLAQGNCNPTSDSDLLQSIDVGAGVATARR
jgi:hypothetical protein